MATYCEMVCRQPYAVNEHETLCGKRDPTVNPDAHFFRDNGICTRCGAEAGDTTMTCEFYRRVRQPFIKVVPK